MKYTHYTKWNEDYNLECSCYIDNPKCDKHKECEMIDFTLDKYADIRSCMNHDKYKRKNGRLRRG